MANEETKPRLAIIVGAGPAGLTAALELLLRTDIKPIVLEKDPWIGGLSRTVPFKGNRIDIGGHRFFSKSDRILRWWLSVLPLQSSESHSIITYQNSSHEFSSENRVDPNTTDRVMLIRPRKSRIYFLKKFFDYPVTLSKETIFNLGLFRSWMAFCSYLRSAIMPIRREVNLEQFLINRFGRRLYRTFFKSYTEKVWGVPCHQIDAEWGRQRIKGLSLFRALKHTLQRILIPKNRIPRKGTETSLIEQFWYPKLGPGQMWEEVADQVRKRGGEILQGVEVDEIRWKDSRILSVSTKDRTGALREYVGECYFSSIPIQQLLRSVSPQAPREVEEVAEGLLYRDFIVIGMLLDRLKIREGHADSERLIRDNWIYIQDPDVQLGRLQIFNNWSPAMVADPSKTWIGLEYFCAESDALWQMEDSSLIALGKEELARIGIIDTDDFIEAMVLRVPKAYPAYFGSYDRFDKVQAWLNGLVNFFPVGRNGMHRYNNQDHSMLTSMIAIDNLLAGRTDKTNIWQVNMEEEYHESQDEDRNS